MFSLLPLLTVTSALAATPIHGGELAGSLNASAYTLPRGDVRLQILLPSSFGLTEQVELQTVLLGLLGGPNLFAKFKLLDDGNSALSVTPGAALFWDGTYSASAAATYTQGPADGNRANVGLGASYTNLDQTGLTTSVRAGYDLYLSERALLQLTGSTDPLSIVNDGSFTGTLGAGYLIGWDTYRLELSLLMSSTGGLRDALDTAEIESDIPAFIPLPFVQMWWRI